MTRRARLCARPRLVKAPRDVLVLVYACYVCARRESRRAQPSDAPRRRLLQAVRLTTTRRAPCPVLPTARRVGRSHQPSRGPPASPRTLILKRTCSRSRGRLWRTQRGRAAGLSAISARSAAAKGGLLPACASSMTRCADMPRIAATLIARKLHRPASRSRLQSPFSRAHFAHA